MLYTAGTPNDYKASILLEELKDAYGLQYTFLNINIRNNEQKEPWYLEINPNGGIPALVDPLRNGFTVFESAAILLYLTQHYDPDKKFGYDPVTEPDFYSEQLQWIFFTHGGIGPMQGQAGHFYQIAPEEIPYASQSYINEAKRLYFVVNDRLSGREYLVGPGQGRYGIADVNVFPWVRAHRWAGVENLDDYPHIQAWLNRICERPQVKKGLAVPDPTRGNVIKDEEEKLIASVRKWMLGGDNE